MTIYLRLSVIIFFVQGCVRPTQIASTFSGQDSDQRATVVVMRPNPTGTAVRNYVYHNGELIGFTGVRSYLAWKIEPGKHTIGSSAGNYSFQKIDAQEGETYYFKQAQRVGLLVPNVELIPLEKDKAMRSFIKLRQASIVDVLPRSAYRAKF